MSECGSSDSSSVESSANEKLGSKTKVSPQAVHSEQRNPACPKPHHHEEPDSTKPLLVIKVGTSTLLDDRSGPGFSLSHIGKLVDVVCRLKNYGYDVLIVTSGAVGAGCIHLNLKQRPTTLQGKQAASAVGQCRLMRVYEDLFAMKNQKIGQLIVTRTDLVDRSKFLSFKSTLQELISWGVVPILNENDSVAAVQLRFGDNDTLAAYVAVSLKAQWLFLLTDVDCLYTANPRTDPEAKAIPYVTTIESAFALLNKDKSNDGSQWGSGGMRTKIVAAKVACATGIPTALCHGGYPERIISVIKFVQKHGTSFEQLQRTLINWTDDRKRRLLLSMKSLASPPNHSDVVAMTHPHHHPNHNHNNNNNYDSNSNSGGDSNNHHPSHHHLLHHHHNRRNSFDGSGDLQASNSEGVAGVRMILSPTADLINNSAAAATVAAPTAADGGLATTSSNSNSSSSNSNSNSGGGDDGKNESKVIVDSTSTASTASTSLPNTPATTPTDSNNNSNHKNEGQSQEEEDQSSSLLSDGYFAVDDIDEMPYIATIFVAKAQTQRIHDQRRWLLSLPVQGYIFVDAGAAEALILRKKSLFAVGIRSVEGVFSSGEAVGLCLWTNDKSHVDPVAAEFARCLVSFGSGQIKKIAGKQSSEFKSILGCECEEEVAHRHNIIFVNPCIAMGCAQFACARPSYPRPSSNHAGGSSRGAALGGSPTGASTLPSTPDKCCSAASGSGTASSAASSTTSADGGGFPAIGNAPKDALHVAGSKPTATAVTAD